MTEKPARRHLGRGPAIVLAGAALAAALGAQAGAALRPFAEERGAPPSPQLMVVERSHLIEMEAAGGGWPGRTPGGALP